MKTLAAAVSAVLCVCLTFGCGSSSSPSNTGGSSSPTAPPPPPSSPTSGSVIIQDFNYTPVMVSISVGGVVTWTNNGPSDHMTVSDAGLWNSGSILAPGGGGGPYGGGSGSGATFSQTFNQAGTYAYHCDFHPDIQGTVIVSQ